MTAKTYTVEMINGTTQDVTAEIVTYDNVGNLAFFNTKKIKSLNPDQNDELELLRSINQRQYVQYYPKPTVQ